MAAVSVEVRRERGIASLNVFCSHCAIMYHTPPFLPTVLTAGFRSSEEEPACETGQPVRTQYGVRGRRLAADCVPAPGRQASVQRETKVVERLETLGFAEVCGPSMRAVGTGTTV